MLVLIRECGSKLYVGLTGIVRLLIQKSMGWFRVKLFFSFLRMSKASNNTKAAMKIQIWQIQSHVGP